MTGTLASKIVDEALALRSSHPTAPARDILDLVIVERGVWLGDLFPHMVPPSPFSLLVAEAMEDCMSAGEWRAFTGPGADEQLREGLRRLYDESVLPRFVERYGVTVPRPEPARRSWFTW